MRVLAAALGALLLAAGCTGDEARPNELADELTAPGSAPDDSAGGTAPGVDPNAWPGQRDEPRDSTGGAPRVVVARSGSNAASATAQPPAPPPPQIDCGRIVDHIYDVMYKQAQGKPSDEARDREDSDRAALAKMCPGRATAAFETCVLQQKTIEGILQCDPISGSTGGKLQELLERGNEQVELPEGDDPRPLPEPLDLPAPVIP